MNKAILSLGWTFTTADQITYHVRYFEQVLFFGSELGTCPFTMLNQSVWRFKPLGVGSWGFSLSLHAGTYDTYRNNEVRGNTQFLRSRSPGSAHYHCSFIFSFTQNYRTGLFICILYRSFLSLTVTVLYMSWFLPSVELQGMTQVTEEFQIQKTEHERRLDYLEAKLNATTELLEKTILAVSGRVNRWLPALNTIYL